MEDKKGKYLDRKVVNVPEAGQLLGISRSTAYSLAAQGIIPTLRLGKRLVVPIVALDRLLNSVGELNSVKRTE